MLANFIPKSSIEWTYLIVLVVLLITLIIFYKGVMKCKHIIEGYNDELRNYKKYYDYSQSFISYAQSVYPSIMNDYSCDSGTSEVEIELITRGVNPDA